MYKLADKVPLICGLIVNKHNYRQKKGKGYQRVMPGKNEPVLSKSLLPSICKIITHDLLITIPTKLWIFDN